MRTHPSLPATVVALAVIGLWPTLLPARAADQPEPPGGMTAGVRPALRTITVTGEGESAARPDRARVRLGVQTTATGAAEALRANSTAMEALLAVVRQAGIPPEAIATSTVQLYPEYAEASPDQPPRLARYRAVNTVEVRVDRLESLGPLLDSAVAAGGNTLEGVSFELREPAPVRDRARRAAMEDARRKADLLASVTGARLGPVVEIVEGGAEGPGPLPMKRYAMAEMAQSVPVEAGEQTVRETVRVTWELRTGS